MTPTTLLNVSFFNRHTHPRNLPFATHLVPHITKFAWGAVAMPNTTPRLTDWKTAATYLTQIREISPPDFVWIGTCYLTDNTDPDDLQEGFENGTWTAAKLYPAGMTTNSAEAVTSVSKILRVLERAKEIGMPILVHGECADKDTHPEFAEKRFMEEVLPELADSGALLVLEHVSWTETAELVASNRRKNIVGATIAPQHIAFDSGATLQSTRFEPGFKRGARPKFICMPPLKMPGHNRGIMDAIKSAPRLFGAGDDGAGHPKKVKYAEFGACGCFTPRALELYATAFDEAEMLELLPSFLGENMLPLYGLKARQPNLRLIHEDSEKEPLVGEGEWEVDSLTAGMRLPWRCEKI